MPDFLALVAVLAAIAYGAVRLVRCLLRRRGPADRIEKLYGPWT